MNRRYNVMQILIKVYKQTLIAVPFSGICGILNYFAQGLFPVFTSVILVRLFDLVYDLTSGENVISDVFLYGVLYVLVYVVVYVLQFISTITINAGIYEKCTSYYKMKISEKTARLPLISFEDNEVHNLQNRAKNCVEDEILSQIYMMSTVFITNGISIVSTIMVLASFSLWFVPISLLSVLPYFIARLIRGKEFYLLKKSQSRDNRRLDYLWHLFHDKQSIKEMRAMGFGDYIADRWRETRDKVNEELWQQNIRDGKSLLFCDALRIIGYGASILLGLALTLNGKISIGVFGACISAFKAVQNSTKSFLIEVGRMPEKVAFANDYFEFLDLDEEGKAGDSFNGFERNIRLDKVSFQYPNCENFAVRNVSLEIQKGEKVVILGVNGSGKTTLSKLILGLYPTSAGTIYYDGCRIDTIEKRSFYQHVTVVSQDFIKYNLTLRENIAISNLSKMDDDANIVKTMEEAGLGELLQSGEGLDRQMGREFEGAELSGGQWQKLAIARGLFKPSDLIVLDEPTSALDPIIETEILKQFVEIAKDKTTIIISHRVGLCRLADKIVVMKDGQICEIGSHDSLISRHGEYQRLYTLQEQWYH